MCPSCRLMTLPPMHTDEKRPLFLDRHQGLGLQVLNAKPVEAREEMTLRCFATIFYSPCIAFRGARVTTKDGNGLRERSGTITFVPSYE
jgi:hypothetical protein